MNIMQSFTACFKKYSSTQGRACRSEFWWFVVPFGVFHFVQSFIIFLYFWHMGEFTFHHLFHWAAAIAVGIPCCTVAVRRMHDVNVPSWLGWAGAISSICFLYIIALLCYLEVFLSFWNLEYQTEKNIQYLANLLVIACICCSLIFWVFCMIKGTAGPNKYGPDPLVVKVDAEKAEKSGKSGEAGDLALSAAQAPAHAAALSQVTGAANAQPAPLSQQSLAPTSAPPVDTDDIPKVQLNAAELEQQGFVELTPEQSQALNQPPAQNTTNQP